MEERIRALLLRWYDENARQLPWRQGEHSAYHTWVSETMLQQTRVETVIPYYARFLASFPTVADLAAAEESEVLKRWEGLGYYSRARNLQAGAKQVMEAYGGEIPQTVQELRKLKGVGPYTAGAIASIAFHQPVAAVDGNVIRVVTRLRGIRENVGIPSVRRAVEAAAQALVDPERPGDFNQAMMDLGATLCVPGTPGCDRCPLQELCDAYAAGDAEELPQLPRKNPPVAVPYAVCLVLSGHRVLMRQRTEALLRGLWVFPMLEGEMGKAALPALLRRQTGLTVHAPAYVGEAKHVFTHRVWEMRLYVCQADEQAEATVPWRFVTLEEMQQLALPTAMKAAVKVVKERMTFETGTDKRKN